MQPKPGLPAGAIALMRKCGERGLKLEGGDLLVARVLATRGFLHEIVDSPETFRITGDGHELCLMAP